MKKFYFIFFSIVVLCFVACDQPTVHQSTDDQPTCDLPTTEDSIATISGTWKIKSLMVNSAEYLYNDHVRDYAPDIAKSAIVFGENNTFELSFVYMDAVGADEPYAEIHRGTYTFDGKVVEFSATECIRAKEKTCTFRGEVEDNMLYISKSLRQASCGLFL